VFGDAAPAPKPVQNFQLTKLADADQGQDNFLDFLKPHQDAAKTDAKAAGLTTANFLDSLKQNPNDATYQEDDIDYDDVQNMPSLIL
jgi:hypothetical protein